MGRWMVAPNLSLPALHPPEGIVYRPGYVRISKFVQDQIIDSLNAGMYLILKSGYYDEGVRINDVAGFKEWLAGGDDES